MSDQTSEERDETEPGASRASSDHLNGKPVLNWTKEDWRRWIERTSNTQESGPEAFETPEVEPKRVVEAKPVVEPKRVVEAKPVVEPKLEANPEAQPRPVLFDVEAPDPPSQAPPARPPAFVPPPEGPDTSLPSRPARPARPTRPIRPETAAARPPSTQLRQQRLEEEPGRAGSAFGLLLLSVLVGALLAGLITAALLAAGLALEQFVS